MFILFLDLGHYTSNIKVNWIFWPITHVLKTLIWILNTILKRTFIFQLMHAKINILNIVIFTSLKRHVDWWSFFKFSDQQYLNLTGSSEYAFPGKAFTWTCAFLKPKEISTNYVFFIRNASTKCVGIGYINGVCRIDSYISKYTYKCLSENIYSLTIPAENMTTDEQNSQWHCTSIVNSNYRSSSILLKVASKLNLKLSKHLLCYKNPKWVLVYFI